MHMNRIAFNASILLLLFSFFSSVTYGDPGFELFNKDKKEIHAKVQFTHVSGEKKGSQGLERANIKSGGKLPVTMPLDVPIVRIEIFNKLDAGFFDVPNKVYLIQNAAGLTKYVTYNPGKIMDTGRQLYPQTGRFGGWSSTSDSGFSLKNNVKPSNISHLQ